ncbi:organic cation transporter 1-like [Watersipora subatra]|uniref:organic cation transporter 1-like n=1 Tax=Watersipora subatra TaxID=2589382 RepID=UPI00355BE332
MSSNEHLSTGDSINDALLQVGDIRKYQICMLLGTAACCMLTSMQSLVLVFTQADMDYRCADAGFENFSGKYLVENMTDQCVLGNTTTECLNFKYSSSVYESTIVSEFDLVCSNVIWSTVANTLFLLTRIPGGVIVGQILDRFGRKRTIVVGLLSLGATGMGTAYAVNVAMYIVFRCLAAIAIMAVYDGCGTFLTEVTTPRQRPVILTGLVFSWGFGICLLSLFGYFIRDWRLLHMAITVPCFAFFIMAIFLFDESPHWLYSQGKTKEAQTILEKIAFWNGCSHNLTVNLTIRNNCELTPDIDGHEKLEQASKEEVGDSETNECMQILRNKRFLIVLGICAFGWLACNMGYSGLAMGLGSLSGDIYIINLIGGATELVSYCIAFLVIPGGRKLIYISLLAAGGVGLITAAIVQEFSPSLVWLVITTTMVGRLSVAAGWQIMYLWCIELFPTTTRATMLEVSMWIGHIGSAAAPFINDMTKVIKNPNISGTIIAPAVYGALLILSSFLSAFLPETNNKPLPVDMKEASANIDSPRQDDASMTYL